MAEERMLILKKRLKKVLDHSMKIFHEELKFQDKETSYEIAEDFKARLISVRLHERIYRKVRERHELLNYDCGLDFDEKDNRINISTIHDSEGIRILDFIFNQISSTLLSGKRAKIVNDKEKIIEAVKKLMPMAVKWSYVFYKKEFYHFVIKTKKCRIEFMNKSSEQLIGHLERNKDFIESSC